VGVLFHPTHERFEVGAFRIALFVHDVLGLPTIPLEGHHGQPGGIGRHRGTVILANHVQTEIQSRCGTSRGEDLAVIDEEYVGVHVDVRIPAGVLFRYCPVRGRAQAIQESGCGQGKRANADRRDPGAVLRSSRKASSTSSGICAVGSAKPGRMIVSAQANASRPHGARMAKPRVNLIYRGADTQPVRHPPIR
jgi:hypothetical protein